MKHILPTAVLALALAFALTLPLAALAQTTATDVRESTDPAKAAAVERNAAALRARPPQPPVGLVRAKTGTGEDLLSGGITVSERVTMHGERERY